MKVLQQFKPRSQSLEHNPPLQQKVRFTEEEHAALKQELKHLLTRVHNYHHQAQPNTNPNPPPQSCQAICHATKFGDELRKRNSDIESDESEEETTPPPKEREHLASHCLALNKTIKPLPFRTEKTPVVQIRLPTLSRIDNRPRRIQQAT